MFEAESLGFGASSIVLSSHHKGPLIPASPRDAAGISILSWTRSLSPSQGFPEPDGSSELLMFYTEIQENQGGKAHSSLCLQRRLLGSSSCFDYFFVLGVFFPFVWAVSRQIP